MLFLTVLTIAKIVFACHLSEPKWSHLINLMIDYFSLISNARLTPMKPLDTLIGHMQSSLLHVISFLTFQISDKVSTIDVLYKQCVAHNVDHRGKQSGQFI